MDSEQVNDDILARVQSIGRLPFEDFVADIFEKAGWDAKSTQDSDDGGVDVRAEQSGWVSKTAVIQTKRKDPGNKVGFGDVQQYHSLMYTEDADIVAIATSTCFTSGAYDYARNNNLKLIDGSVFAGFIRAQDCESLLEDYQREHISSEIDIAESFAPQSKPRDQFYSEQPVDHAARMLSDEDLIDVVDMVQNVEVGRDQIEALHLLERSIRTDQSSPPVDPIERHPQLIDGNWYDIEILDTIATEAEREAELSGKPPENSETICIEHNNGMCVVVALPVDHEIGRSEFAYTSDLGDYLKDVDSIPMDDEITGKVIGGQIKNIDRKVGRHPDYSPTTYTQLIERNVTANQDLLNAVEPFFRGSDKEMLDKITRLREVASSKDRTGGEVRT